MACVGPYHPPPPQKKAQSRTRPYYTLHGLVPDLRGHQAGGGRVCHGGTPAKANREDTRAGYSPGSGPGSRVIDTGLACQMSSAYCRIVRSLEKKPAEEHNRANGGWKAHSTQRYSREAENGMPRRTYRLQPR